MLLILSLCGLAANLSGRYLDPLVTAIARDLAVPVSAAALLSSAFTLPFGLSQPLLGPIGDALGKPLVFRACLWLLGLSLAAAVFAESLSSLTALRVVAGFACAGIIPLGLAMLGEVTPPAERQVAFARFSSGAVIGQLIGLVAGGSIAAAVGWRAALMLPAVLALAAALLVTLRLPQAGELSPRTGRVAESFGRYRVVLRNRNAPVCFAAVFAEGVAIYGSLPYIVGLLEARHAGGAREAGFVVAGIGLGALALSFVVRPILRRLGSANMMRVGGVLAGLGLAGLVPAAAWWVDTLAFGVTGFGYFMLHNSLQNRVVELAPGASGAAVALHYFSFFVGQALGPVLFGLGLAWLGAPVSFALCALVIAATGVFAAALIRPPPPPQSPAAR
jgi:predicted MFS family arabinose efflux permease